jgi:hypothetical protein
MSTTKKINTEVNAQPVDRLPIDEHHSHDGTPIKQHSARLASEKKI